MDVWYASYGSNLLEERFLAYIYGGTAKGASSSERGCRDKSAPKANERIDIPFPLYFAKKRSKWGIGGVAFIGTETSFVSQTIGRKYLITEEQFYDVVTQENNGLEVAINLEEVIQKGFMDIHHGWYNRIVYLGKKNDAPIFTFTSSQPIKEITFTKPAAPYLATIAKGLRELGLSMDSIVTYLMKQKGIQGNFTRELLAEYLN